MDVCHRSDARCVGKTVYDDKFDLSSPRVQKSLMVSVPFISIPFISYKYQSFDFKKKCQSGSCSFIDH